MGGGAGDGSDSARSDSTFVGGSVAGGDDPTHFKGAMHEVVVLLLWTFVTLVIEVVKGRFPGGHVPQLLLVVHRLSEITLVVHFSGMVLVAVVRASRKVFAEVDAFIGDIVRSELWLRFHGVFLAWLQVLTAHHVGAYSRVLRSLVVVLFSGVVLWIVSLLIGEPLGVSGAVLLVSVVWLVKRWFSDPWGRGGGGGGEVVVLVGGYQPDPGSLWGGVVYWGHKFVASVRVVVARLALQTRSVRMAMWYALPLVLFFSSCIALVVKFFGWEEAVIDMVRYLYLID